MEKLRNGALYIRVSTDKQEELSPDAQRRLLLDYAAKNNIILSNEYIFEEDGISGRKADKRPNFQRMIGLAKSKEHPFDVILVWKFSRFARNQEESIVYKSLLRKNNVEVISVSEPLVDGPFGTLIERIIEWMDEYYSIRLSGEVTRGMTENAMRGNFQSSPPLGYMVPAHKEVPVIVESEAAIVRLIFDMYTEHGYPLIDITRQLNALGYRTRAGNEFENRGIKYILSNEVYTGKTVWNKRDSSSRTKSKDEWIIADGSHEPIITPEQFEKARNRLSSNYRPKYAKPSGVCSHWLSGIVKCSACGRTLSISLSGANRYGKRYIYLQCYGYLKGKCNVSHRISEKKIVPMVLDALKSAITAEDLAFNVIDSEQADNSPAALDIYQNQLDAIAKKENRIKMAYVDGIDTLEEYKKNKQLLQDERRSIEERINLLPAPAAKMNESAALRSKIKTVYDGLLDDSLSMQSKNELIKSVVEKIVFNKKSENIDVYFYTLKPL